MAKGYPNTSNNCDVYGRIHSEENLTKEQADFLQDLVKTGVKNGYSTEQSIQAALEFYDMLGEVLTESDTPGTGKSSPHSMRDIEDELIANLDD